MPRPNEAHDESAFLLGICSWFDKFEAKKESTSLSVPFLSAWWPCVHAIHQYSVLNGNIFLYPIKFSSPCYLIIWWSVHRRMHPSQRDSRATTCVKFLVSSYIDGDKERVCRWLPPPFLQMDLYRIYLGYLHQASGFMLTSQNFLRKMRLDVRIKWCIILLLADVRDPALFLQKEEQKACQTTRTRRKHPTR